MGSDWAQPSDHLSGLPVGGEACFYTNAYKFPGERAGMRLACSHMVLVQMCPPPAGAGVPCVDGRFSRGLRARCGFHQEAAACGCPDHGVVGLLL